MAKKAKKSADSNRDSFYPAYPLILIGSTVQKYGAHAAGLWFVPITGVNIYE